MNAIPTFNMQTLRIPKAIYDHLEFLSRIFYGGGFREKKEMHLLSWDRVRWPKIAGGLGF